MVKQRGFQMLQKAVVDCWSFKSVGSWFQACGMATVNARSPTLWFVCGTTKQVKQVEDWRPTFWCLLLNRYRDANCITSQKCQCVCLFVCLHLCS